MPLAMESDALDTESSLKASRYSACLLFAANALARAMTVIGDEEFGKLGLTYSHAYLLREVIDKPGVTPSDLSETLHLTPSTITRLIEKLEAKALVTRRSEGRHTLVDPTAAGEAMSEKIGMAWQQTWSRCVDAIGQEQATALTRQVFTAAQALEKS